MRTLFEVIIPDTELEECNMDVQEAAGMTANVIFQAWYNQGVFLKRTDEDNCAKMNIYGDGSDVGKDIVENIS